MCCASTVVVPWETKFERSTAFVHWITTTFNVHTLFELHHDKFKRLTQNPGESVHGYNVRWNLEREIVDELALVEVYAVGSIHEVELENMYIHNLTGSFESKLLDLRRFQKHVVKSDNEQIIASEIHKINSPRVIHTWSRKSFTFTTQSRDTPQRITHLGVSSRCSEFEDDETGQTHLCQDLFVKLQTDGKVNWSPAQTKRLWDEKWCFR